MRAEGDGTSVGGADTSGELEEVIVIGVADRVDECVLVDEIVIGVDVPVGGNSGELSVDRLLEVL